jgi:hypothetical protein
LEPHERSLVLLHILEYIKTGLYVIDDLTRDMPRNIYLRLKDRMERISREGGKALCLTTTLSDPPEEPYNQSFFENILWKTGVEPFKDGRYWNGDIKTRARMNKINDLEQGKEQTIE